MVKRLRIPILIVLLLLFILVSDVTAYVGKSSTDDQKATIQEEIDVMADLRKITDNIYKDFNALFESQKKFFEVEGQTKTAKKPVSPTQYSISDRIIISDNIITFCEVLMGRVPMLIIYYEGMFDDIEKRLFYGPDPGHIY